MGDGDVADDAVELLPEQAVDHFFAPRSGTLYLVLDGQPLGGRPGKNAGKQRLIRHEPSLLSDGIRHAASPFSAFRFPTTIIVP